MSADERAGPAVQLLGSVANTLGLALFALLALGPLVAGFAVPLGPPQHTAHLAGVSPADGNGVAYESLSPASQAAFDDLLASPDDRIARQTAAPPALLRGETVVVRGEYAYRVVASRSGPPLRPVAVLAGLVGSVLGTLLGGALLAAGR